MLDRYDLGDELGTAARSAVVAAREKSTGRIVAVKLTPSDPDESVSEGPELPSHPNICAAYAAGERRGVRYTVAEFAPGVDCGAFASVATRLPLTTVLYIAERVSAALHHAHRHGIVHGDVKPSNIVF